MLAVTVDRAAPGGLVLAETDAPSPAANEALIKVAAVSLNRGEVHTALHNGIDGMRPGWDFAGIVEQPAADGSGPPAGSRVVGMMFAGAWAERLAAPTRQLAQLPDGISFTQASTLPVAGLTAVHALRRGGDLAGKPVLITGASGGVGVFAVQLAALAGAKVAAALRSERHAELMRRLGAQEIVIGPSGGPYHLILESVGGDSLAAALGLMSPGGTCVLFGASEGSVTTFDASKFRVGGTTLYGLFLGYELITDPPGAELALLAGLVAEGRLDPGISVERPWTEVAQVAADLMARKFTGKAVLTLPGF